jgi:hypothetical protein
VRVECGPAQPTLAAAGIDKHLADRARKAAAMPEAEFEAQLARRVTAAVAVVSGDISAAKAATAERQAEKRNRQAQQRASFDATLERTVAAVGFIRSTADKSGKRGPFRYRTASESNGATVPAHEY